MLRPLAHFLLSPLTLFWLPLLAALIFHYLRRPRPARLLIWSALAWLFLISVSPMPIVLADQRESRHPVVKHLPDSLSAPHVLVLGGDHDNDAALPSTNQLSPSALARLAEGIRLYRQRPGAKLIGSGYTEYSGIPQGEMLMRAAVALGVPPADTLILPSPSNTEQEAYAYARRFGTQRPLVLVTSAIHLPRAVHWFRSAGLSPLPAPAHHQVKRDPERTLYHFRPSAHKVEISGKLLHEWAGMAYARYKTGRKAGSVPSG